MYSFIGFEEESKWWMPDAAYLLGNEATLSLPWNQPFLLEALIPFSGTKVWELGLLVATLVFAL